MLFVLGLVWGLRASVDTSGLLAEEAAAIDDLADFLTSLPQPLMFIFIFLKNVSAVVVCFVLSPVFLLAPVAALVVNGGLLGLVSVKVIEEKSLGYLLAGILPHGIFELPALMIGEAAALSSGFAVMQAAFSKEKRNLLRANLRQNAQYLALSIILLLPAALIETYVTPMLVR